MLARLVLIVCLATLAPVAARALDLSISGSAEMTREITEDIGTYRLPVGPFADGALRSLRVEGRIIQQAWRTEAQELTTAQLFNPLRDQLVAQGFNLLFECAARACGGFDFRFNTRVMAAPDMFVDLFDYRFLSARRATQNGTADYVSVLVSRAGSTGYVQILQVGGTAADGSVTSDNGNAAARPSLPVAPTELDAFATRLTRDGHIALSDLDFKTGASELSQADYASLDALARFLRADSSRRIALVGHTDSVGGLDNNIALSKRRAAAVLERLATRYDVSRAQMDAQGIGYLAPVVSNLSAAGREANRRVEAVLLNVE